MMKTYPDSHDRLAPHRPRGVAVQEAAACIGEHRAGLHVEDSKTGLPANLKAVVLLGGSIRPTALHAGIRRSILDLPVRQGYSLLDHWRAQGTNLARRLGVRQLPIRLVLDPAAAAPSPPAADEHVVVSVERDPSSYRGSGGVVRDLAVGYGEDDYILVATAAHWLEHPLASLASELNETRADVAVLANRDGTPSGLMLIRCGCLVAVPRSGFVDMKEQALARIAARHRVRVVEHEVPSGLPVRILSEYIEVLRRCHRGCGEPAVPERGVVAADFEDWRSEFAVVERGDDVHPQAGVHNSVVLAGAKVESGALVVGSVVCPGAVVPRNTTVLDELVVGPAGGAKGKWRWKWR